MNDVLPDILVKKPWIGADEGKDLADKKNSGGFF